MVSEFLGHPLPLVAVERVALFVLDDGDLDAFYLDVRLEWLEFFGRKVGKKLVFRPAVWHRAFALPLGGYCTPAMLPVSREYHRFLLRHECTTAPVPGESSVLLLLLACLRPKMGAPDEAIAVGLWYRKVRMARTTIAVIRKAVP